MKRQGNLFPMILDRDNLLLAFRKAARGKVTRRPVVAMRENLDQELAAIASALADGRMPGGTAEQFLIHDPKRRVITAPCFHERVAYHAIINVCEPVFDRWLIDDTFACRPGRGREAAVLRAATFATRWPRRARLDVRHYFNSVPHDQLLRMLSKRFKDRRLLNLFEEIVRGFRGSLGKGLPIGSLTSQHFANFYLGWLDRFVKETLRITAYVRYMDDILIWTDSEASLRQTLQRCEEFASEVLRLNFKPPNCGPSSRGVDFLGARVFPTHTTLNRRSRRRFGRRVRTLERAWRLGVVSDSELQQRLESLAAFARGAGVKSWQFRSSVLNSSLVGDH